MQRAMDEGHCLGRMRHGIVEKRLAKDGVSWQAQCARANTDTMASRDCCRECACDDRGEAPINGNVRLRRSIVHFSVNTLGLKGRKSEGGVVRLHMDACT